MRTAILSLCLMLACDPIAHGDTPQVRRDGLNASGPTGQGSTVIVAPSIATHSSSSPTQSGKADGAPGEAIRFRPSATRASDTRNIAQPTTSKSRPLPPPPNEALQMQDEPAAPPTDRLTLATRQERSADGGNEAEKSSVAGWFDFGVARPVSTALAALAIVVGLFLMLAWVLRRSFPKAIGRLPNDIVEVLGRAALTTKQSLHLVRIGGKLIVVSITPAGAETLTEIDDPQEVNRILSACQQQHGQSTTAAFRELFEQVGQQPAHGFLDAQSLASGSSGTQRKAA